MSAHWGCRRRPWSAVQVPGIVWRRRLLAGWRTCWAWGILAEGIVGLCDEDWRGARPGGPLPRGRLYGSDAEFRALIVPFAEEGIAAGEPVIIGYDDRKSGLLRSWLTDPAAVEFIGDKSLYATPARAIATYRRLFEFHVAMGAARDPDRRGRSSPGQRGTVRGLGPLRIGGQHRLAGLPGVGPVPVRQRDRARGGARCGRANPPPHRLAVGRAPGQRPLPGRHGIRGSLTRPTRSKTPPP